MRLAWFTPWPPQRSGVAGRSAEVLPHLASRGHALDVFVDERFVPSARRAGDAPPARGEVRVQSAHEFVWRAARDQYDLVVYQVGNSIVHEFMWPYLRRWPGLVVLHDTQLHHARGRSLLAQGRRAEYRAELHLNHPELHLDAAELAIAGFDGPYYYLWPMLGSAIRAARLVAVHAPAGAADLAAERPTPAVVHLTLGEGRSRPITETARAATRNALQFLPSQVVFGVFGGLTGAKRLAPILRAFAATAARSADARLLCVGTVSPTVDIVALADSLGIGHLVTVVADADDERFDELVAAVDVSMNLRWPSSGEISGPWLRALAAGRPTVITDSAHQGDVPALDPRTWQSIVPARGAGSTPEAVAVAIDILDEDHSLRLAMHRLVADKDLRMSLGRSARAYWERTHTVERMVNEYEAVLVRAAATPPPELDRRHDPLTHTRDILAAFGDAACVFD